MSLRCAACGEELAANARFCSACGAPVAPAAAMEPASPDVPPELRAKFESVRADLRGERRQVVMLFADLQGFTSLAEGLDPEEVTLLVGGILQELAASVYRYEGYVDKFMGDAIMALFGAPLAHEDDPERAVLAGLDMVERVARRNQAGDMPLALRVGIHAGEVVAAHLGDALRLQYTVVGDAVNVAARLEHEAAPNTVLVSDTVHARVRSRFDVVALDPVEVRGRVEPIPIFRIEGMRVTPRVREAATAFVGRRKEVAALERLIGSARGLALLEGEAGAGKSRLAREAIAHADPRSRVIELAFSAVRRPGELEAEAELFRRLTDSTEKAVALAGEKHRAGIDELARAVGWEPEEPEDEDTDPSVARGIRWRALAGVLRGAAAHEPTIVLVEDLHWADAEGIELLSFLTGALAGHPVAWVLTGRTGTVVPELPAGHVRIPLEPLDEAAAEALVGGVIFGMPPSERRALLNRAAGNPLFLEELARALRHGGAVPDTIQGLIRARIDRLDAPAQAALQMAAVLGSRFPLALLERMYGLEAQPVTFAAALASLESGGFVAPLDGERRFTHDLIQEVAYAGLLVRIRKVLHESAARLGEELFGDRLEAEAPFFAHHYWEAGLAGEAFPYLWLAGRDAAHRYDLPAAERNLRRAAESLEREPAALGNPEERAHFVETLGKVLLWRGDFDGAERWFELLEAEGRDYPAIHARALELRGRVAWHRGRLEEAQALFESGLAIVPADEKSLAADLHNALGVVLYYRRQPEPAFRHHETALDLRRGLEDLLGMAKSHSNIGNLLADLRGDLDGAQEQYARALELATAAGDRQQILSVVHNLGSVAMERGAWTDALKRFKQAESLHEEIGWSHLQWVTCLQQAECEIGLGRIGDALGRLQACLKDGDKVLEPVNRVRTRLLLVDAWLCARADDRAAEALAEARALAASLGAVEMEAELRLREGRMAVARGAWPAAAEAFAEAETAARGSEDRELERLAAAHRARAEARAGSPPRPPSDAGSAGEGATYNDCLVAYLLADAEAARDPTEAAAERLSAIADRAARLGSPALEQAALASLARVHFARGDEPAAREALDRTARATLLLADGLPAELRSAFLARPRSAL